MDDRTTALKPHFLSDARIGWAVFAAFAVVNIALLGHRSLWLDEFMTLDIARPDASFAYVLTERLRADRSPPLYFILVHFWMGVFGDGEVALRSLNLVGLGILGAAMAYSRRLRWMRRAWLAFWILLLTSRFAWDFVTEGRSYFLLFSGTTLLCVLVVDFLQRMEADRTMSPALLAVTALTTLSLGVLHYFGFLIAESAMAVLAAMALVRRRWRDAGMFLAISAVMLANLLIWVLGTRPSRKFWLDFDPLGAVFDFVVFSLSSNLSLVALGGFALYAARRGLLKDVPLLALAAIGAITFAAAFAISLKQPLLHARYLIVLAPPLLLILARLLAEAPQRWVLPVGLGSALLLSLPVAIMKSLPSREDWRGADRLIEARFAGQCRHAVMMAEPTSWQYIAHRYHARGRDWTYLPMGQASVEAVLAGPCPVLAWAGHITEAQFQAAFAPIDWKGTPVAVVRFRDVYLVLRKQS